MYIALTSIAVLAGLVFMLSPRGLPGLYSKIVFEPTVADGPYTRTDIDGIPAEDVWLRSANGRKIHARFYRNPRTKLVFVLSHGNAGNVDLWSGLAGELLSTGASVFLYDYQGYGLSEGSPNVPRAAADGLAAYRYVTRDLGFTPEQVILYGLSLGTGVTTTVAASNPCVAVVLTAGFVSLRLVAREMLPLTRFLPDFLFFRPRMDSVANLAKIHVPLRVVHGEKDQLFGRHHALALFNAGVNADKKLVWMPDCVHSCYDANHRRCMQELVDALA